MSTTTRVLDANVNGTVYTANANAALEALDTCHSGATAPTDEVANGKLWLDTSTTPGILKIYNNAAWEVVVNTADVTASGALMDSELTDIAAVKALNQGVATTDSPTFAGLSNGTDTVEIGYVVNGPAKAWGAHDSAASPSLLGGLNVSSITDNATGQTAFNLTSAMVATVTQFGYSVQHSRVTLGVEASAVRGSGNNSSTIQTITNVSGSDVDRARSMIIHGELA